MSEKPSLAKLLTLDPPNPLKKEASEFKVPLKKGGFRGISSRQLPNQILFRHPLRVFPSHIYCLEKVINTYPSKAKTKLKRGKNVLRFRGITDESKTQVRTKITTSQKQASCSQA
jgi:hypothetical protein